MKLSEKEKLRYSRHLILPHFGSESQEKLKKSKVLVVGTGGLGAPVLQYLTAAGIGTIGVIDFDKIDETNLQRQVLFSSEDIGKAKTSVAIEKLSKQNPNVNFIEYNEKLISKNAREIIAKYDVVADGTDNFPTRYLINDACFLENKVNVYASIFQFEGQVSVFNYKNGPNYRDLYPSPPPPGMVPSCAEGGVLGVLPGIIGSIQALETIKVIGNIGDILSGKLLLVDTMDMSFRSINIRKDPKNPLSGENKSIKELIDYDEFCGLKTNEMKTINVNELSIWMKEGAPFVLIDVREKYEYETSNLGGIHIPMNEIEMQLDKIPKEGKVVMQCRSGQRSAVAINHLMNKFGYDNLINLEGGIVDWKNKIDPEIVVA